LKTAAFILITLIWTTSYGQLNKLEGTWITSLNDVVIIDSTKNEHGNSSTLSTVARNKSTTVYLVGDTLSFQERLYSTKEYEDRFDLLIADQTDSTLTLVPISELSKKFYNNRASLKFVKQEYNVDSTILFERLVFNSTLHYGACPIINLEIDREKNVYVNRRICKKPSFFGYGFDIDSLISGSFTGKLSDSLFTELITIIQTSNLRSWQFPERRTTHAASRTLIIYHNSQRKYLRSDLPPAIAYKLVGFLYLIGEKTDLLKTEHRRNLEW
jgi:hypothetical protein